MYCSLRVYSGQSYSTFSTFPPRVFDLTQMFGSTVADYIYTLETNTAGAGVAFFRSLFPNAYYAYNAGQLISVNPAAHKTVGFNLWDEKPIYDKALRASDGEVVTSSGSFASDFIPILPNTSYYCTIGTYSYPRYAEYDAQKNYLGQSEGWHGLGNGSLSLLSSTRFIRISCGSSPYSNDICINLSDASRNGTYEPYKSYSNPFGSIEIRGIPKLVNNALTFDGDSYKCDGQLTRKYGIVDLGSLTWEDYSANVFRSHIAHGYNPNGSDGIAPILCGKYSVNSVNNVVTKVANLAVGLSVDMTTLYIYDTNYNSASAFKAALSGVYLLYQLATPTTESIDPFTSCQVCDPNGTEEWVDAQVAAGNRDVSMPVQTTTKYPIGYAADIARVLMPITTYSSTTSINNAIGGSY